MQNQNLPPQSLSRAEGSAMGKALRDKVPRSSHEEWKPAPNRPDSVALLEESNQGRLLELVPIRYGRMLKSPFAFLRGAANIMAADLSETPKTGIKVQTCGDCHLSNFGGYGTRLLTLYIFREFSGKLFVLFLFDLKCLLQAL